MDERKKHIDDTFKVIVENFSYREGQTEYDVLMRVNTITQALINLYEAGKIDGLLQRVINE